MAVALYCFVFAFGKLDMQIDNVIRRSLTTLLCLAAVVAAVVETCTAWTVFSIFFGVEFAAFLCVATFQFAASDAILVFESTASEMGRALALLWRKRGAAFCFWLFIYLLATYVGFCVFMPFSYMQHGFQTSVFLYVYCGQYHQLVPVMVHFLIMPSSFNVMLNALSKVWSLIRAFADFCEKGFNDSPHQQAYDVVSHMLALLLCAVLTLTLSEGVYISMQYGVTHYKMMHAVSFTLTRVQESLLLSMIALSTYKTMHSVTMLLVRTFVRPLASMQDFSQKLSKLGPVTYLCHLWGYFTVFVRAAVRGIQTASVVHIAREMTVAVADKGRSNAAGELLVRATLPSRSIKQQEASLDDKDTCPMPSVLRNVVDHLINFRCL